MTPRYIRLLKEWKKSPVGTNQWYYYKVLINFFITCQDQILHVSKQDHSLSHSIFDSQIKLLIHIGN